MADFIGVLGSPAIPRLDSLGIPVVTTTGVTLSADSTTVDYGINPFVWAALPLTGIILWQVRHSVPAGGEATPTTVVLPTGAASTVVPRGSVSGTTKAAVVDSDSNQVRGEDITTTGVSDYLVLYNKCTGLFKVLGKSVASTPTPAQ